MSIMLSKTASSDPKSSWRRWASWPCLPSQHHLWPHGRECALKDASVKFSPQLKVHILAILSSSAVKRGKKSQDDQQQRMTNKQNKMTSKKWRQQQQQKKKTTNKKICAKETGIRSVSTNPLLWTLRPPIGPLLGWYSQQRCLWTRCQTSGWVGFDKGKFPTRKRWVGAAPFGKFLRETSKTNG